MPSNPNKQTNKKVMTRESQGNDDDNYNDWKYSSKVVNILVDNVDKNAIFLLSKANEPLANPVFG